MNRTVGKSIIPCMGTLMEKVWLTPGGASPVYLLGRYFAGVYPTAPGFSEFSMEPVIGVIDNFNCAVPVKDGVVEITISGG